MDTRFAKREHHKMHTSHSFVFALVGCVFVMSGCGGGSSPGTGGTGTAGGVAPIASLRDKGSVVATDFTTLVQTWTTQYGGTAQLYKP